MSRTSRLLVALTLVLTGAAAHRGGYWSGATFAGFAVAVLAGAWAQRSERRADRVIVLQGALAAAILGTVLVDRRPMWLDVVLVCAVLLAPGARGRTAQLVVVCTLPLVGFMVLDRPHAGWGGTVAVWGVAALGALGALGFEHRTGRLGVGDPVPARRAHRRHLRDVAVAGSAVVLLAPLLGARLGGGPGAGAGDGPAASADLRSATFDGYLNLADRSALGDTPLLRVHADQPDFWRTGSLDTYDGRVWTRTIDAEAAETPDGAALAAASVPTPVPPAEGETALDPAVPRASLTQRVTVLAGSFTTIPGAVPISQLAAPNPTLVAVDGTAAVAPALRAGDTYTVVSDRPLVTADILRAHDPRTDPTAIPAAIAGRDLALPAVPQRVLDLARAVAADQPTSYDVVRALEAWMGAHTEYTLAIPALPAGADAVDQFLFVDRRGFCAQIGSALTVMLRSLGIPARLAVGFVPGERQPGTSDWLVRSSDYHAWVEVWFPGVGWQPFDPTAEVPLAGDAAARPSGAGTAAGGARAGTGTLLALAAAVAAIGAGAVGAGVLARRRRRPRSVVVRWDHLAARRLGGVGEHVGRPRRPDETLVDFGRALAERTGDARYPVVAEMVSRAAYHRDGIAAEARSWVDATLVDLERDLPAAEPVG